jgi:hypothetical protein
VLGLRNAGHVLSIAVVTCACAQPVYYAPPALPREQSGMIKLDSTATLQKVDELVLPGDDGASGHEVYVAPGCHALVAKYDESFFKWGDDAAEKNGTHKMISATNTTLGLANAVGVLPADVGVGVFGYTAIDAAHSHSADYETQKPVHFFFAAKPGYQYWLTATFTGDEFLPRLVEIAPNGERVAKLAPEVPCGQSRATPPAATTSPAAPASPTH